MAQEKIFIGRQPDGEHYEMRIPRQYIGDLYRMICAAPLMERQTFYEVKQQLEDQYCDDILRGDVRAGEERKEVCHE